MTPKKEAARGTAEKNTGTKLHKICESSNSLVQKITLWECDKVFGKKFQLTGGGSVSLWRDRMELDWAQFVERCRTPERVSTTTAEYKAMTKDEKKAVKSGRCFFPGDLGIESYSTTQGEIEGARRTDGNVLCRTAAAIDIDGATGREIDNLKRNFPKAAFVVYSTMSHTPEAPRLRVVLPYSRPATVDENAAITWEAIKAIRDEGTEIDPCSIEAARVMYYPRTTSDGDFVSRVQEGSPIDIDATLEGRDIAKVVREARAFFGVNTPQGKAEHGAAEPATAGRKKRDPKGLPGMVGLFCRAYSVKEAIDTFLSEFYKPAGKDRYTYAGAGSAAGVHIMGDFAYSFHASDKARGEALNAYDLVRKRLFGELDKPDEEMLQWMDNTPEVAKRLQKQRAGELKSDGFPIAEDEDGDEWRLVLTHDKHGNVVKRAANFQLIAINDPELQCIRYDVFHDKYVIDGGTILGRETPYLIDEVLADIAHHVDERYGIIGLSTNKVMQDIVTVISKSRRFHPVKDDIESVAWDGKPRVDGLLIRYLGAPDTALTRAMTRKWMAAAVARIYEPGIKYDYILVLAGKEGTGKSTLLKVLGGDFYNDSFSFGRDPKEMGESVSGYWIIEAAELDGLNKSEIGAAKKFITSQSDNYREAYGRVVKEHPRQCVVAGTTNEECFLRTTTGARRWWIVDVEGAGDPAEWVPCLIAERGQIWAEAKVIYEEGEPLFLTASMEAEARELQRGHDRLHGDGIDAALAAWLDIRIPYNWHLKGFDERRNYYRWDVSQNDPTYYKYRQLVNARIVKAEHPEPSVQALSSQKINEIIESTGKWKRTRSTVDFSKEYGSLYGQERGWRREPGTEPSIGDDGDDDL